MKVTHQEVLEACLRGEAGDLETSDEQIGYFNAIIDFVQSMQRFDFTIQDVEWDNHSAFHVVAAQLLRVTREYSVDDLVRIAVNQLRDNLARYTEEYQGLINEDGIARLENGDDAVGEMGLLALAEALDLTFYIYDFSSELRIVNPGNRIFFFGFDGEHYVVLNPGGQTFVRIGLASAEEASRIVEFYDSESEDGDSVERENQNDGSLEEAPQIWDMVVYEGRRSDVNQMMPDTEVLLAILQQNHIDYPDAFALNENGQIVIERKAMYGSVDIQRHEIGGLGDADGQMVLYNPNFYNPEVIFPGYRNEQPPGFNLPESFFSSYNFFAAFNDNIYIAIPILLGMLYLLNGDNELCG